MLPEHVRHTIEQACVTVHFQGRDGEPSQGRGALIPGQLILTAAHCVDYSLEGGMALGDHIIQCLETASGQALRVGPLMVDPVQDIAVLGSLDNQVFFEDSDAFETWCEATTALPLRMTAIIPQQPFPVWVYTHTHVWKTGQGQQMLSSSPRLWLTIPERILGGTSGSPVVDAEGAIVAIVSSGHGAGGDVEAGTVVAMRPQPLDTATSWKSLRSMVFYGTTT